LSIDATKGIRNELAKQARDVEVVSRDRDRQRRDLDDCRPAAIAADARRGEEMKTGHVVAAVAAVAVLGADWHFHRRTLGNAFAAGKRAGNELGIKGIKVGGVK